jgi:hypothetical protein
VRERERERVYLNQCIKEVKMKGNEVEGSDKSKGGEQHNLSSSKDQKETRSREPTTALLFKAPKEDKICKLY